MSSPEQLLERARAIAVVGCSDKAWRDSHRIAEYLMRHDYNVYPVNPALDEVLGVKCYPDVKSIPEHVDIVDVFRNPRYIPDVVEDAIAAGAGALWLQLGLSHTEAERRASEAGLEVVSDLCIMVVHRMGGVGRQNK